MSGRLRALTVLVSVLALAGAALAGMAAALLALGYVPGRRDGDVLLAMAVGVVVTASLGGPARRATMTVVERLSGRTQGLSESLLDRFADRAATGVPNEDLLRELGESLRRTWNLASVRIWTGEGERLLPVLCIPRAESLQPALEVDALRRLRSVSVAGSGWLATWLPDLLDCLTSEREVRSRTGRILLAPGHHGRQIRVLLIVQRGPDQTDFTAAEEQALTRIARRMAIVLHNQELDGRLRETLQDVQRTNDELRASRARLAATADVERRRIERDLHDGAQQHLVSLAITLGLLRGQLTATGQTDTSVCAVLDDLDNLADEAVESLRDLARGIFPALLRDAGLERALLAAARRYPMPVEVSVAVPRRLDAAIEAAVYFCCTEALQNVVKHAAGTSVVVRVWVDGGVLRLEVTDTGPGFDPSETSAGSGLHNMADRLGAVGGHVDVRSSPRTGTIVAGSVPVRES